MGKRIASTPDAIAIANDLGTVQDMVTRVLGYWDRGTPAIHEQGAQWYGSESAALLASLVTLGARTTAHAAAVVAHLSPQTRWSQNVAGATALIGQGPEAARKLGCMGDNVERAARALASDAPLSTFGPSALKTHRFALNLMGDRSVVTVDVWAARIAFPSDWDTKTVQKVLKRGGVYLTTEHAYQLAAEARGVSPETMQAATWIVVRNGRAG